MCLFSTAIFALKTGIQAKFFACLVSHQNDAKKPCPPSLTFKASCSPCDQRRLSLSLEYVERTIEEWQNSLLEKEFRGKRVIQFQRIALRDWCQWSSLIVSSGWLLSAAVPCVFKRPGGVKVALC